MTARRTNKSRGLVNWPQPTAKYDDKDGFCNTGEGGMECWLIVNFRGFGIGGVRGICNTGFNPAILPPDAVVTESFNKYMKRCRGESDRPTPVEAAVCIGGTGMSLWNCRKKYYWQATFADLKEEGQMLFATLHNLYGIAPKIVMVLDT